MICKASLGKKVIKLRSAFYHKRNRSLISVQCQRRYKIFQTFNLSTVFCRIESRKLQCILNYFWHLEQEDPLELIAEAIFSKPLIYIYRLYTVKMTGERFKEGKFLKEKSFRTVLVVIYFAIKNKYVFYHYQICGRYIRCYVLPVIGQRRLGAYIYQCTKYLYTNQAGGLSQANRAGGKERALQA